MPVDHYSLKEVLNLQLNVQQGRDIFCTQKVHRKQLSLIGVSSIIVRADSPLLPFFVWLQLLSDMQSKHQTSY